MNIHKILNTIGLILFYIYPYKLISKIRIFNKYLYSAYVVNRFKYHGEHCIIHKNSRIIGEKQISLGDNVRIDNGAIVSTWTKYGDITYNPRLVLGNSVHISDYCHISCINEIIIEDNVLLGKKVLINDNAHGDPNNIFDLCTPPENRPLSSKGKIHISKNVWIGEGACILAGVNIGQGAIIGANAVVTKDIPNFAIAVGVPARIIKNNR